MKKLIFLTLLVTCLSIVSFAQPRPAERTPNTSDVPASVVARYEGGTFGRTGRETGVLKFDDENMRVVFYRKDNREMFAIPYESLLSVYPDSKKAATRTGNVVSHLPLPGAGLASLMSKRARYVIMDFDDQDLEIRGNASFKIDDKAKLLAFIDALGSKAKMTQRGDAYYRPKRRAVY
jgi:hypothetical protein